MAAFLMEPSADIMDFSGLKFWTPMFMFTNVRSILLLYHQQTLENEYILRRKQGHFSTGYFLPRISVPDWQVH